MDPDKGIGHYFAGVFDKIPFEELGIRLSGVFGFGLGLLAALIFFFFDDKKLNKSMAEMEDEMQAQDTESLS